MKKKNVLAIGAHPDDIEIGCGGTLIKFSEQGHKVHLLVMTNGSMGEDPLVRTEEQMAAKSILGAEKIFWGGYEDTSLVVDKNMIDKIEKIISEIEPAVIFCHFPEDTHQDHRHLCQATVSATRYIRNVLLYEGPTSQNFTPHIFSDIKETLDQKMAALNAHKSQIKKTNIEDLSIVEMACSNANFRGIQGRVKYAEGFHSLRFFLDV